MRNKKAISIALSAVMAFTTAFGMTSVKANADEKEKIVVYVAAEGKNASGSAVAVSKTAIQLDEGAVAEDAIKTALDKSAYKDNYKISSSSWGDSLDSIADLDMYNVGNDWYYWGFFVNGQYANLGISSQKVNNNDKISLIYSYNNYNTSASCFNDDASKNPAGYSVYSEKAKKAQDVLAQKIYDTTFKSGKYVPGVEDSSGLYTVFSLARAGFKADKFYDAVYAKVKTQLGAIKTSTGKFYDDTNKKYVSQGSILKDGAASQTYAKIALCVTALGKDASDVNGFNLIEKLADKSIYEASSIYSRETMILMAIDSNNYELKTADKTARQPAGFRPLPAGYRVRAAVSPGRRNRAVRRGTPSLPSSIPSCALRVAADARFSSVSLLRTSLEYGFRLSDMRDDRVQYRLTYRSTQYLTPKCSEVCHPPCLVEDDAGSAFDRDLCPVTRMEHLLQYVPCQILLYVRHLYVRPQQLVGQQGQCRHETQETAVGDACRYV